jgi:hypothetical protein
MAPLEVNDMIISDGTRELEIKPQNWSLAENLFIKWGYNVDDYMIEVDDIDSVTPELSVWGVPWKWL